MNTYDDFSILKVLLSPDSGMWIWERPSDTMYFNEAYMKMLGYSHRTFSFHLSTWINLLHPDDRDKILSNQLRLLESPDLGDSFEDHFRLRMASGEYLWVLERGFVLCRDEQGHALRVCGMQINMDLLEDTLEDMGMQHDRMLFALEAANDGLWDWNPQTDEVYFSPRYLSMLGYTSQKFPPKLESWLPKIHPDDVSKTIETQRQYICNPAMGDIFDCVYRFMDVNGEYRWILGRGKITKRDENGYGTRVVGLHTDVTELRNTQEALEKLLHKDSLTGLYSRYYLDSILNGISAKDDPVSIIFCDLDGLKIVNDTLGHTDGDQLLIHAASVLQCSLPPNGMAARLGGDEFAMLLRNTTPEETQQVAARIEEEIARHNKLPYVLPIFMSIGIVTGKSDIPIYKLLSNADKAMLQNKRIQRNTNRRILISHIEKMTGRKVDFVDNRLYDDAEKK